MKFRDIKNRVLDVIYPLRGSGSVFYKHLKSLTNRKFSNEEPLEPPPLPSLDDEVFLYQKDFMESHYKMVSRIRHLEERIKKLEG